jgi:hypothetical protein
MNGLFAICVCTVTYSISMISPSRRRKDIMPLRTGVCLG